MISTKTKRRVAKRSKVGSFVEAIGAQRRLKTSGQAGRPSVVKRSLHGARQMSVGALRTIGTLRDFLQALPRQT